MFSVKIAMVGAYTTCGGMLAFGLGFILGAGPCNATLLGVILMIAGIVAVPAGFITLLIGLIVSDKKPADSN
jgi:hypothetical protein